MTDAVNTVTELLAQWETPEAVHAYLVEQGIKGRPDDICDCPVARLLKRHVPELLNVKVTGTYAYLYGTDGPLERITWPDSVLIPEAVRYFIERFDEGRYLDLVEER